MSEQIGQVLNYSGARSQIGTRMRSEEDSLNEKLKLSIRKILSHLKIPYLNHGTYIQCRCPIHESDSITSLTIYPETGRWMCWSYSCHENCGYGLLNMVKAFCKALNVDLTNTLALVEKTLVDEYNAEFVPQKREIKKIDITRQEIREKLSIPSKFYLNRGFSAPILDEWLVGDCFNEKMKNRAVVPVFDIDGDFIGCSGRSHQDKSYIVKWKHSKGLPTSMTFFGIDKAKDKLKETKKCILVEGFSDVIRLHSYGFTNCISPFGIKLSYYQAELLKKLGVKEIILAFDPDPPKRDEKGNIIHEGPGPTAAKKIAEKYKNDFNIKLVNIPCDPDELTLEQAEEYFKCI